MFTLALVGADGAGKTTIGKRLADQPGLRVKYVYMGVNLESSHLLLPTTRLVLELKRLRGGRPDMAGPPDPSRRLKPPPKGFLRRSAVELKALLRLAVYLPEEWFRQGVIWYFRRQGNLVILDRDFLLDYYFHDVIPSEGYRTISRRIHGWILKKFYPRPDLVIYLDAPAEVLFARKGEGTLEMLESRRQEYLKLEGVAGHFAKVDATQSEDQVTNEVTQIIWDFYHKKAAASRHG